MSTDAAYGPLLRDLASTDLSPREQHGEDDGLHHAAGIGGEGGVGDDPEGWGFRRLDLAAFLAEEPPEFDYLLDGLLEFGELCWLAGRGKVGKSLLALFLANALLDGAQTFLGRPVGAVDWVIYIDGENREPTIRRRVHLAGMSAEVAAMIDYRSVRGIDLGSPEGIAGLRALVDRPGRGLVILDSLVALHTIDENTAGDVRWFSDLLRTIFEPSGVTTLGLAHENRSGNLRGSLDWRNAADRVLELVKDDAGVRELRNGEVRDGPEDALPATFRFVSELDGMHRRRLVLESSVAAPRKVKTKAEQLAEQAVLLLRGDSTLTRAETARQLGYSPDHGTFRSAWKRASELLAGDGAETALHDCPAAGQAGQSPYRDCLPCPTAPLGAS